MLPGSQGAVVAGKMRSDKWEMTESLNQLQTIHEYPKRFRESDKGEGLTVVPQKIDYKYLLFTH